MILECNGKKVYCNKLVFHAGMLNINVYVDDRDDLADRTVYPEDLAISEVVITDDED